jgi:hypothetical protein
MYTASMSGDASSASRSDAAAGRPDLRREPLRAVRIARVGRRDGDLVDRGGGVEERAG